MQITLTEGLIISTLIAPLLGWIWRTEVRMARQQSQLDQTTKELTVIGQIGSDLRLFMSNVLDRLARIETRLEERNH